MKSKFLAKVLVSAIALSSAVGLASPAQAQSEATTFRCVTQGRNYATIARRGDRTTPPLIIWKTNEFGREYTPQQRCRLVSERLTTAVSNNGGRLTNLLLTTGTVNRQPVVCYVNGYSRCNSTNTLFTMDRRNADNPEEVLDRLVNFGTEGSGDAVISIAKPQTAPQTKKGYVNLESVVNRALKSPNAGRPKPNNNSI